MKPTKRYVIFIDYGLEGFKLYDETDDSNTLPTLYLNAVKFACGSNVFVYETLTVNINFTREAR